MKILIAFFLLISNYAIAQKQTISTLDLRQLYNKAIANRSNTDAMIAKLEALSKPTPMELGYLGSAYAMIAYHDPSYITKYKSIVKGRKIMSDAIDKIPNNPEIRFLRFSVEHFLPAYLGMSGNIKADLQTVFLNIGYLDDDLENKKK